VGMLWVNEVSDADKELQRLLDQEMDEFLVRQSQINFNFNDYPKETKKIQKLLANESEYATMDSALTIESDFCP
jgi:hypothetical protein